MMDIEDLHPLRDRAKFDHILPSLSCLRKCKKKKPDFKHALRKTLLEEMQIKMPKSESQIIEDPFLILGYGVNAYFDIMLSLVYLCITVTLFAIPLYWVYSQNQQKALITQPKYTFTQFTLGNMGGDDVFCASKRRAAKSITIDCTVGQILTDKAKFGVMSSQVSEKVYCEEPAMWAVEPKTNANCTAEVDEAEIKRQLKSCAGDYTCTLNFTSNTTDPTATDTLFKSTAPAALTKDTGYCGAESFFYV